MGLGAVAVTYLTFNYLTKRSDVKLSAFLRAVKLGYVEDVIIEGKSILFRSAKSEWYRTFYGSFPMSKINDLLKYLWIKVEVKM